MIFYFVCAATDVATINGIQFIVDEDCLYEGYELEVENDYVTYQWESLDFPNENLGEESTLQINFSSTYCLTVTDDQGVSCNACIDIELLDIPYPEVSDAIVCSEDTGFGPTVLDFSAQIIEGSFGGFWSDDDFSGVDLSDITNVDFLGVAYGTYQFTYTISVGSCGLVASNVMYVDVVECLCPELNLNPLGAYCNDVILNLDDFLQNSIGEWSSNELSISNNILDLTGSAPGNYILNFDWTEIAPDCPSMFSTTIEVIGCFDAQSVLFVESNNDKVIFSWTDELQALDLSIDVLQGPEGVRDGNTYTISVLMPGEEVGIEIFVNTEGYLYDNDLIIYGQSLTTSIQESELLSDIILCPNPVQDHLYIDCSPLEYNIIATISLSNGYRVFEVKDLDHNSIDISDLPSGMYYLTLEAVDGIKKLPFVKQ